tara:strand:- start:10351 stop:10512 length:162 start_codon:yes stop_codon:yes gene_type:complete
MDTKKSKFGKTKKRPTGSAKNPRMKDAGLHRGEKVRTKGYSAQLKGTGNRPRR